MMMHMNWSCLQILGLVPLLTLQICSLIWVTRMSFRRGRLHFKKGLIDEDINTIVTPTAPAAIHTGPITRARARQLNYQVLSFLSDNTNVHENMMLPNLDTFVLLRNEGPSMDKRDEQCSKTKHGDDSMRKRNKNRVTSDDFKTSKPP